MIEIMFSFSFFNKEKQSN